VKELKRQPIFLLFLNHLFAQQSSKSFFLLLLVLTFLALDKFWILFDWIYYWIRWKTIWD